LAKIYINSTGSVGAGIFLSCFSTVIAFISTADALAAGSRSMFAMSRDGLFPAVLAKVNPRFDIPLNALLVVSIPTALLCLIYLGNETAFYGLISGTLVSTMLLYSVPIALMLLAKLKHTEPRGPWVMNKALGLVVNTIGSLWAVFLVVILSFPTMLPVTADNMYVFFFLGSPQNLECLYTNRGIDRNYASVLVGGVMILCAAAWFLHGRTSAYEGALVIPAGQGDFLMPAENVETASKISATAKVDRVKV
jgi:amino acid transporter